MPPIAKGSCPHRLGGGGLSAAPLCRHTTAGQQGCISRDPGEPSGLAACSCQGKRIQMLRMVPESYSWHRGGR